MRRFIRHPTDFPVIVHSTKSPDGDEASLCDISQGGVACNLFRELCPSESVTLGIPSLQQDFRISGVVVRCGRISAGYRVGIRFSDEAESFKSKMVEQVCQIELFRQQLCRDGRDLDSETAAREWIERFGRQFAETFSN